MLAFKLHMMIVHAHGSENIKRLCSWIRAKVRCHVVLAVPMIVYLHQKYHFSFQFFFFFFLLTDNKITNMQQGCWQPPNLYFPGLGGWYSYRLSKAALNMSTRNLSLELGRGRRKVICISLHPGTVDTDLSRPYHRNVPNLFSVEHSVNSMMAVIDSLTVEDTGKFFTYDRTVLPFWKNCLKDHCCIDRMSFQVFKKNLCCFH